MSGTMSKYILEDDDVKCFYPDIGHCPIKCMSRNYAHMFLRFQDLEQSIKEMKNTLDTVMDYVIRGVKSSSSSDSDKARDKKKATKKGKKSRAGSRSGSDVIDQDMRDVQATVEMDCPQLISSKNSDDEGGEPKKPRRCEVIIITSDEGDTSECDSSGDEHQSGAASEANIMRNVSEVIDDMAKVVDEIRATAGIAEQLAANVAEMQAQIDENGGQSADEEENDEPDYAWDFFALYNEMNDVD